MASARYWCTCIDYQKLGVCCHSLGIAILRGDLIYSNGDDHRPILSTNPAATAKYAKPGGGWDTDDLKPASKKKAKWSGFSPIPKGK